MYLFFTIFGILFVSIFSTIIYYIYDLFSINKITTFLNNTKNSIWNNISITLLPILIWSMISIPVLGNNKNFPIGLTLNIFISLTTIYVIKYSYFLLKEKQNNFISLIAIYISTILGNLINYIILMINPIMPGNMFFSIIFLFCLIGLLIKLKISPPQNKFFIGIIE